MPTSGAIGVWYIPRGRGANYRPCPSDRLNRQRFSGATAAGFSYGAINVRLVVLKLPINGSDTIPPTFGNLKPSLCLFNLGFSTKRLSTIAAKTLINL